MRKLVITEEERKSIFGMYGIVEQTTPNTTSNSGITPTTQTTLTPAEQKRQEYLKKREEQKKANAARLAPIEAAQEERIKNWMEANPGSTREDYFERFKGGKDVGLPGLCDGKTAASKSCRAGKGDSTKRIR